MAISRLCSIDDCGKPARTRGWCDRHYKRALHHGSPLAGRTLNGESERYFREVVLAHDDRHDCLTWPYATGSNGYGRLYLGGRVQYTHRLVCAAINGPPPTPKHEAAHSCGKGHEGCCNPHHLSWKTSKENGADMIAHGTSNLGKRWTKKWR